MTITVERTMLARSLIPRLLNYQSVSEVDRDGIFACTKSALQILASSADLQIQYYPDFVLVADELALDFDYWRSVFLSNFASELTPEQTLAFAVIDE